GGTEIAPIPRSFPLMSLCLHVLRSRMKLTTTLLTAATIGAIALSWQTTSRAAVSNPTLSPPVTGGSKGQPFGALAAAGRPAGYVEEERFFSGTATSYAKSGAWGMDGLWTATPAATAPYKVRMLIRRPADAR